MDIEEIQQYCATRKGAISTYKEEWECEVVTLGGKMFAMIGFMRGTLAGYPGGEIPILNLKCDPVYADELRLMYKGVIPGYHMNKKHWNTVLIGENDVPGAQIKKMIDDSYSLVLDKLPKNLRP